MELQEKIKTVAIYDNKPSVFDYCEDDEGKGCVGCLGNGKGDCNAVMKSITPDYDSDFNALIPVAKKVCEELFEKHATTKGDDFLWYATAIQDAARTFDISLLFEHVFFGINLLNELKQAK